MMMLGNKSYGCTHLCIIETVFDLLSVHVDAVVVVLGVHYESSPFSPPWRNVGSVVLVQVLPKITRAVAHIGQVRGKGLGLMCRLPHCTGAVVVVREHVMIVDIHPSEDTGPSWAAHGCSGVRVSELSSTVPEKPHSPRHKAQRSQLHVLIIGQN